MKKIIPFLLIFGALNMSCGKAKKEEPVKPVSKKVSNVVKPDPASVEPDRPQKDVAVIASVFGDCLLYTSDAADE